MMRIKNKITLTIKLVSYAVFVAVGVSAMASEHREAAAIYEDPTADITDFYAYISPNDLTKLVMAMNVNGLASPISPESYQFSNDVRYNFNIDTNGDAKVDYKIKVLFSKPNESLNQKIKVEFNHDLELIGESTFTTSYASTPPAPVINEGPQGIKFFAGLRDDPFFFDIVAAFRSFQGIRFSTGIDRFAGLNVSAIVVELPLSLVLDYPGQKLQIWADTQRKKDGKWKQIQRVGNPAVKPIFIPPALKNQYNSTLPHDDERLYSEVIKDAVINKLGQTDEVVKLVLSQLVPDTLKLDPTKPSVWPNGRGLDEDTIDLVFSYNLYKSFVFAPGDLDGVHHNDVDFLQEFPYLAPPHIAQ